MSTIKVDDVCYYHSICERFVESKGTKCAYEKHNNNNNVGDDEVSNVPKGLRAINDTELEVLYECVLFKALQSSKNSCRGMSIVDVKTAIKTSVLSNGTCSEANFNRNSHIVCLLVMKRIQKAMRTRVIEGMREQSVGEESKEMHTTIQCTAKGCNEKSLKKTDMSVVLSLKLCTSNVTDSPTKNSSIEDLKAFAEKFVKASVIKEKGLLHGLNEGFRACAKCRVKINRYIRLQQAGTNKIEVSNTRKRMCTMKQRRLDEMFEGACNSGEGMFWFVMCMCLFNDSCITYFGRGCR